MHERRGYFLPHHLLLAVGEMFAMSVRLPLPQDFEGIIVARPEPEVHGLEIVTQNGVSGLD